MRHIETIVKEDWFFERPWLLLGTGPSLDDFDYEKYKDHNIVAVYSAGDMNICGHVDIHLLSDKWQGFGYDEGKKEHSVKFYQPHLEEPLVCTRQNTRYIATRICNYGFSKTTAGNAADLVYFPYDIDNGRYDVDFGTEDYTVYRTSNTSSFAVMFLGMSGVKEIKTCGIDGGIGTSKRVDKGYQKNSTQDFTIENYGVYGHAKNFGINLIRI